MLEAACRILGTVLLAAASAAGAAEATGNPPIIDAHFHVMPYMDLAELQKAMDRSGIRAAGGAIAIGGPRRNVEVANALGLRYIRATGQGQWLSLKDTGGLAALENADSPAFKSRLASMEADLRDNGARVVGEIHVNSENSAANPRVNLKVRADAPTLKAMLDLASKYKRALNVHAEWSGDTTRELAALAASNREARLVLSHCGVIASASDIREAFEKNSNILCDLSFRSPPQLKSKNMHRMVFDDGHLRDDWKKLIEDYPDRFMVGIDDVHSWDDYESTARNIRSGLLANLTPDTAAKVAWKNAEALFGLK